MSPVVHGAMYPEVQATFLLRNVLRALVDPASIARVSRHLIEIDTLRHYLRDLSLPCQIHFLLPPSFPGQLEAEYGLMRDLGVEILPSGGTLVVPEVDAVFPVAKGLPPQAPALASAALRADADIVLSEDLASQAEVVKGFQALHMLVVSAVQTKRICEVFVRGHEVPWTFDQPIWGIPWTPFHVMVDPDIEIMKQLLALADQKGASAEVREHIRSLGLNRWSAVAYTRDKLLFYVLQRRAANRGRSERQDFSFELSYHLNHYFLLFWAGLDQACWIVNGVCGLGFKINQWRKVGVAKADFLKRLATKDPDLLAEFQDGEFRRWVEVLTRTRHYVAHEGTARLSPLDEAPQEELSEAEIDREIERSAEWREATKLLPGKVMDAFRPTFRLQWKQRHYRLISDAALPIRGATDTALVFPLENIEWEYERFREFLLAVARKCMARLAALPDAGTT